MPVLAAQRRHDRVLEPARAQECVERVGGATAREQRRASRSRRSAVERGGVVGSKALLRVHEQFAFGAADTAQRPLRVGGREEQDLGVLGAEQPARGDQQLTDRETVLRRSLRRPHRLVEELHVLALLALLHVAAERGDGGENRHDEQEDGERPNLEEGHDGEAERCGREAPSVEVTSVRPSCGAWKRSSAIAITAETSRMPDDVGHGAREQDEHPQMQRRVGRRGERAEDQRARRRCRAAARRG